MSNFDWEQAGKDATSSFANKRTELEELEAKRMSDAAEEQARSQVALERFWAALNEIKTKCIDIADSFNSGASAIEVRLNVLGGGLDGFSVIKGNNFFPRLEFSRRGMNRLTVAHQDSPKEMSSATEQYVVQGEGEFLLAAGKEIFTTAQVTERSCRWLVAAQFRD